MVWGTIIAIMIAIIFFIFIIRMKSEGKLPNKNLGPIFIKIGMILLVAIVFLNSFFLIDAGNRGVVFNYFIGVKSTTYNEGLHFKIPFFEKVYELEVRTKVYNAEATAASKDLQVVSTNVALNYHLDKESINSLFKDVGIDYEARIISPSIQETVKSTTAKYIAEELITKRELAKEEIKASLKTRLAVYNIVLDELSITNFDFSPEFNKAIELKVTAEQKALEEQNNLKVVDFQAKQMIVQAEGEAKSIQIVNEELRKSPAYINYMMLQKWDGKMPLSMGGSSLLSIAPVQDVATS